MAFRPSEPSVSWFESNTKSIQSFGIGRTEPTEKGYQDNQQYSEAFKFKVHAKLEAVHLCERRCTQHVNRKSRRWGRDWLDDCNSLVASRRLIISSDAVTQRGGCRIREIVWARAEKRQRERENMSQTGIIVKSILPAALNSLCLCTFPKNQPARFSCNLQPASS